MIPVNTLFSINLCGVKVPDLTELDATKYYAKAWPEISDIATMCVKFWKFKFKYALVTDMSLCTRRISKVTRA